MQMTSISVNDTPQHDPPLQTTMSDQSVEALGSKIQFLSVLETFPPLPPKLIFSIFSDCTDNIELLYNIELGAWGYQRINARWK